MQTPSPRLAPLLSDPALLPGHNYLYLIVLLLLGPRSPGSCLNILVVMAGLQEPSKQL